MQHDEPTAIKARSTGAAHFELAANVTHIDPSDAVFQAMLRGWRARQHSAMQRFQERHFIIASMSRKANRWDNAVVESFFSTLKLELIENQTFATREQARAVIFDWIEIRCNRRRRHSTSDMSAPSRSN